MEMINNEKYVKDCHVNRSENTCDVLLSSLSSYRNNISRSHNSSSVVLPNVSNKDKNVLYKKSLKSYSSLNNLSSLKNSKKKLRTYKSYPSYCKRDEHFSNNTEKQNSLKNFLSHQSINIIKENNSNQYLYENNHSKYNHDDLCKATTKIKLSLPVLTNGLNNRRRYDNNELNSNTVQGEFTLPTNPPITVTIQPQTTLNNETISKDNSLHDDQIYSPDHLHIINKKRSSLDTSLKGTSTIVNYFMDLLKPSDNKLAMKLFGSKKGVLKERLRQQRSGHCIIHPCSNFR